MGENSAITWTHHTFNPWWGCMKVSPGCTNCYAETMDKRVGGKHWGPNAPRRKMTDAYWRAPAKWNAKAAAGDRRERVFCASMADVFEDNDTITEERTKLWRLIAITKSLDWLLLTKRPENLARFLPWCAVAGAAPWPNVWIGVTAEDQARYDQRWPILRETPAAVRFISYEPALSEIDFGWSPHEFQRPDWVIFGDESGPVRRPAQIDWARSARDQCYAAGVAFHFKQWAGAVVDGDGLEGERGTGAGGKIHLPILDGAQHAAFPAGH